MKIFFLSTVGKHFVAILSLPLARPHGGAYHPSALVWPTCRAFFFLVLGLSLGMSAFGCATLGPSVIGYLDLKGVEQQLVLADSEREWQLGGKADALSQLDRLVEARVRVWGTVAGNRLLVRDFELLEAPDGMRPYVGQVVVDQSGTRIDEDVMGTPIYLQGEGLKTIRRLHGSRVWVTGSVVGAQTLLIAHWGLLKSPQSSTAITFP